MAELVYDVQSLTPGEPVFVLHVDTAHPTETVLASLTVDLVAPIDEVLLRPERFNGFEHRAGDIVRGAHERAAEQGARKTLVVDPYGLLRLAGRR